MSDVGEEDDESNERFISNRAAVVIPQAPATTDRPRKIEGTDVGHENKRAAGGLFWHSEVKE